MEYLKIVKNKINVTEKKLGESMKESEAYKKKNQELEIQLNYYKTKSEELENAKEKVIEKEKLMAMKYGIILSQNKELLNKLKKIKAENDEIKGQLQEHLRKESISDTISNEVYHNKIINQTTQNHKRDHSSPMFTKNMAT